MKKQPRQARVSRAQFDAYSAMKKRYTKIAIASCIITALLLAVVLIIRA